MAVLYVAEMAWIEMVDDDGWNQGALAELKPQVIDPATGEIDNIMAIHSLNPVGLSAHDALYRSAMSGTATLRKVERELLALVVSQENECHY